MTTLNPYISFETNAREALEFYQGIFSGELTLSTFGEYGDGDAPYANNIMHGQLNAGEGLVLMAADTPPGQQFTPGSQITISLSGDDAEELRGYFAGLSEGGTVAVPLAVQMWGDEFGMCTDKYGIAWMVNIAQPGDAGESED